MSRFEIGQKASFSKTISEYDVYSFAGITGDFNGVHVNRLEAEKSIFGGQVAHGCLVSSFISTVLGMMLPGKGTILLEMNVRYERPVHIGDTIKASVEITNIEAKRATLDVAVYVCECNDEGVLVEKTRVVSGNSKVMLPQE